VAAVRADEVYRFLVLRDPDTREATGKPRETVDPRLVDAAIGQPSELLYLVKAALGRGDLEAARAECGTYLSDREPEYWVDRARLAAGSVLCQRLRALVHIPDSDPAARDELERLESLGIDSGVDRAAGLAGFRAEVADLLVASVVTASTLVDRAAACASILAAEAGARLLADAGDAPTAQPWRPAVAHGRVILPIDLTMTGGSGGVIPGVFGTDLRDQAGADVRDPAAQAAVGGPPSSPARLVATGAVRTYVGDLVTLDQQLRRYTLGEVAHVENVLASEKFERVKRNLRRVVTEVSSSSERETIDERDLQSTERDELRSELAKTLREDIHVTAEISASVSGKTPNGEYAVAAGGSFAYDRASEQREERAQAHVREVVERARQQITERTRSARTTTTTAEDEDTTTHGFDNQGSGAEHVVGVYRWIEKEYDLHLVNLGRRLFYEVVLPEPAAFWKAVSARRTEVEVGPPPTAPSMAAPVPDGPAEPLSATQLALRDGDVPLERPGRWLELVALAGDWGVELPEPPPTVTHLAFQVAVAPLAGDTSEKPIHAFGDPDGDPVFYQGVQPRTASPEKPPTVPYGYEATEGRVAVTGEMVVGRTVGGVPNGAPYATRNQFERGEAYLQIGGRQVSFAAGFGDQPGQLPVERSLEAVFDDGATLTGDLPVALTTNLNTAVANVRLICRRTRAAEVRWVADVLDRFATAYAERVARHADASRASVLDQRQRDFLRSEASYREIERRELKRQVIDLLVAGNLELFGAATVTPPGADRDGHVLAGDIDPERLPQYTRLVNFFEQAFDWTNLVASYAPYFYGRASQWESDALTDEDDARFAAFLSAGAARVQIPAQLGFEPAVEAYFADLGPADPRDAVPWLPTGRPIALDLAGAARAGFELWPGTLSGRRGSARVTVDGNTFAAAADTGRELRIAGHVFRIVSVPTPTELELDRALADDIDHSAYERGGLVLGPPIPLRLPSTLVAIDTGDLTLPTFAGRYS
jgi:hypothetical protein